MQKTSETGRRGEEDSHLPAQRRIRERWIGREKTSQHSHKKMGYLIRTEQALLLVKEDLTESKSCFPSSHLARFEEWREDHQVSLTDGFVLLILLQAALISVVGSHLAEKMSPKQMNWSRLICYQQMQRIPSAYCR